MKYDNKKEMKKQAIKLYLQGKNYVEISDILGCSRNYVSTLIRNDNRIIEKQNKKILKVYKNAKTGKKNVTIGIDLLSKIGIDRRKEIEDYVQVEFDKNTNQLILKKHKI